ncbi:MAG: hypothetical protein ACRBF0_11790 [Calditrichia bacterium]
MHISKTGRHLPIRPELLSVVCGILWAAALLLLSTSTMLTAPGNSTLLFDFVQSALPGYSLTAIGILIGVFWAFAAGYIFGFLIGFVYKMLMRRKLRNVSSSLLKINPSEQPFVIQEGIGEKPYTIAFVANPFLLVPQEDGTNAVQIDPIMAKKELFHQVVVRCLRSFANNGLLRQPEIFNRLRLVIYFDPNIELDILRNRPVTLNADEALCIGYDPSIIGPIIDTEKIYSYVKERITSYCDVVYMISASDIYTRSSARFTQEETMSEGVNYNFTFTPDTSVFETRRHAWCAKVPGVVALSAWDDRLKTPVHEFAHAMSSVENGAIDDEYIDDTFASLTHRINKQYRVGYILNDAAIEQLRKHAPAIVGTLMPLKDRPFADRIAFLDKLKVVLSEEELNQYLDVILEYAFFRPVFFLTETSIAKIVNAIDVESDKDKVRAATVRMKGKRFYSRSLFYREFAKEISNRNLFMRYRSLVARFSHFQNYPVPHVFAHYKLAGSEMKTYYSDRNRSDKEMSWRSFSPERSSTRLSCIMDIAVYGYRFDKLLFDWMYDRLYVKMNRPATACSHPAPPGNAAEDRTHTNIQINLLNEENRS